MKADIINGLFELSGSVLNFKSCVALYRSKTVKGVYAPATAFFAAWGLWNLFYYPSLDQWFSFLGGLSIVTANMLWVGMAVYYARSRG